MAYTKQTWTNLPSETTPFSATRMEHMEDGIETANTLKGGLIAFGSVWTESAGDTLTQNTNYGFSGITSNRSHREQNFISGILEYDSTAKTLKVHTKGVVGYIRTFMTISGQGSTNTSGIWFSGKNNVTLPTDVSTMFNNYTTIGLICVQKGSAYTGASNELSYDVRATGDVTITIDPIFQPYGGSFTPGTSGTRCTLTVEVYAKYE